MSVQATVHRVSFRWPACGRPACGPCARQDSWQGSQLGRSQSVRFTRPNAHSSCLTMPCTNCGTSPFRTSERRLTTQPRGETGRWGAGSWRAASRTAARWRPPWPDPATP
eukprot:6532499-Prymnesium_polylepis.1